MAGTTMAIVVSVLGQAGRKLAQLQRRIDADRAGLIAPHLPLIAPFDATPSYLPLEQHCWDVCHRTQPFDVELGPPAVDGDGHLVFCPVNSGREQLAALRRALLTGKYAPCDDAPYEARCVVLDIETPEDVDVARREVAGVDAGAPFTVDRIQLMARYPSGHWYERDFYTLDAAVTAA
jgi:hypothetical protein